MSIIESSLGHVFFLYLLLWFVLEWNAIISLFHSDVFLIFLSYSNFLTLLLCCKASNSVSCLLLPLWEWAACVYQCLMHRYSFTMTRHVPSCFSEACSIPEPCLCRGFLQRQSLPYQISYFLHDYVSAHLSQDTYTYICHMSKGVSLVFLSQRWNRAYVSISLYSNSTRFSRKQKIKSLSEISSLPSSYYPWSLALWALMRFDEKKERGWISWGVKEYSLAEALFKIC